MLCGHDFLDDGPKRFWACIINSFYGLQLCKTSAQGGKIAKGIPEIPIIQLIHDVFRVINQGRKGAPCIFIEGIAEERINSFADGSAATSKYVGELFVFTVHVGNKKFCRLRESQLFAFSDDLHGCFFWGSK